MKAPSSHISRLGAEGEACLEVPVEEIRMSCFFFPPWSKKSERIELGLRTHPVLLVHEEEEPEDQENHEDGQDDGGYQPLGGRGLELEFFLS